MKKKLISLAQLAVGLGLIAFIVYRMRAKGDLSKLVDTLQTAAANWPFLLMAFVAYFICVALCACRWDVLLKAQGVKIRPGRVLVLYFIGQFFNAFLLGATSGDIVKAYYAAKETLHKKTEVVATVFVDRAIGLFSIIALMVVMMIVRFHFYMAHRETRMAMLFNTLLLFGAIGVVVAMLRRDLLQRWSVFNRSGQQTRAGEIAQKAYNAFHSCLGSPAVVVKTVSLSLVNHVGFVVCCYMLGTAVGIRLALWDYLAVIPTIAAFTCIPVTPSGLGTREGATIYLLGIFGVPSSQAFMLSILTYFTLIVWAMVGGVVYMVYSYSAGRIDSDNVELTK
jgi:glycosyltransferase 2 family protein